MLKVKVIVGLPGSYISSSSWSCLSAERKEKKSPKTLSTELHILLSIQTSSGIQLLVSHSPFALYRWSVCVCVCMHVCVGLCVHPHLIMFIFLNTEAVKVKETMLQCLEEETDRDRQRQINTERD